MNPYWINPAPDTAEWLESERQKRQFYTLVVSHIVLWVLAAAGIVFLFINAQKITPVKAFTAAGEPAFGKPMAVGEANTRKTLEEFLDKHIKSVLEHLFMRTEKGAIPQLKDYTDTDLLAILDKEFRFVANKKGGWSQTLSIDELKLLSDSFGRRVYRFKGTLSSHSLDGSANTPVYLLAALDKKEGTIENPLGWVVNAVVAVSEKEYFDNERQALIDEVTHSRSKDSKK